jgi:hypothetical protein
MIVPSLQKSKQELYQTYFGVLREKAARAQALLALQNDTFGLVPERQMMALCLDESMTARKELVLACRSNKALASIGNAHMSTFVALMCYRERATPQRYQEIRDTRCTQAAKAAHFDTWFRAANGEVLLHWSFETTPVPTVRQKADFVDALVGLLVLTRQSLLVEWLLERITK